MLLLDSVLYMSVKSNWLIVLRPISSLIFSLAVLSVIESGVLRSPTIIVELSISHFNSVGFWFICFVGLFLGT